MLFTSAVGSVLDQIFLPWCKNPLFVWLFVAVCIITVVTTLIFMYVFRNLNKEEDEWNALDKTSTNLPMAITEKDDNVNV
jgi:hypothetical protein